MTNENDAVTDKKKRAEATPLLIGGFDTGRQIAHSLIPQFHDSIVEAKILFLCRNTAQKSGGRMVAGTVKKASPLERYLGSSLLAAQEELVGTQKPKVVKDDAGNENLEGDMDIKEPDFIITVALEAWNPMSGQQRVALMDHLLSRCVGEFVEKTGETRYKVRSPQVQEFPEVVERNGRWNDDLVEMGNCIETK